MSFSDQRIRRQTIRGKVSAASLARSLRRCRQHIASEKSAPGRDMGCAGLSLDVSCQSSKPGITTAGSGPSEDNYVEIAQTIPDPRASRLVGSGGCLLWPRPEARGTSAGSATGIWHGLRRSAPKFRLPRLPSLKNLWRWNSAATSLPRQPATGAARWRPSMSEE